MKCSWYCKPSQRPQSSISFFTKMPTAQTSCKHRVWATEVLLWRPEDLAFPSTAAHATLNTPHSAGAFSPSDIRVKQTRRTSALRRRLSFGAVPSLSIYRVWHQCRTPNIPHGNVCASTTKHFFRWPTVCTSDKSLELPFTPYNYRVYLCIYTMTIKSAREF